jgi:hypothetical protein
MGVALSSSLVKGISRSKITKKKIALGWTKRLEEFHFCDFGAVDTDWVIGDFGNIWVWMVSFYYIFLPFNCVFGWFACDLDFLYFCKTRSCRNFLCSSFPSREQQALRGRGKHWMRESEIQWKEKNE